MLFHCKLRRPPIHQLQKSVAEGRQAVVPHLKGDFADILGGLQPQSAPGKNFDRSPNVIAGAGITVKGIIEGDSVPSVFIPRMVELYQRGLFSFDKLIKFYDFDQINQAAEDSEKGITIKPVIRIGAVQAGEKRISRIFISAGNSPAALVIRRFGYNNGQSG